MQSLSNDVIALLQYLLPGFVTAWVLFGLTSHERPSQFERIIQALIYSMLVSIMVIYTKHWALFIGRWVQIGRWSNEVEVFRSEEHTSELQSLMRISYAVFCLKKKKKQSEKTYV